MTFANGDLTINSTPSHTCSDHLRFPDYAHASVRQAWAFSFSSSLSLSNSTSLRRTCQPALNQIGSHRLATARHYLFLHLFRAHFHRLLGQHFLEETLEKQSARRRRYLAAAKGKVWLSRHGNDNDDSTAGATPASDVADEGSTAGWLSLENSVIETSTTKESYTDASTIIAGCLADQPTALSTTGKAPNSASTSDIEGDGKSMAARLIPL
ncbi:hypothetical protein TWF730_004449 [Orbilia blumenaviensis]|uniref:Uncharacterized protein n=1 Tax=Orbilia blumenaviensis TaxID=1796055 RepID=A0AAV9TXW6_9PEZI